MSWWIRWFAAPARLLVRLLFLILYRYRVEGLDHLPGKGPAILASTHGSFLDPPLIQAATPRLVVFTPRATLSRSWLYRVLALPCAVVPIRRGEADLSATRKVLWLLNAGEVVALFPEERRSDTGRTGPLKAGFHLLARKSGAVVVPVHIAGAYHVWPRGRRRPRLTGQITVRLGPALELGPVRDREQAVALLEEAWVRLGAEKEGCPRPRRAKNGA